MLYNYNQSQNPTKDTFLKHKKKEKLKNEFNGERHVQNGFFCPSQ